MISEVGRRGPVSVIGLCSGAVSALEGAVRASGLGVVISPALTVFRLAKGTPAYARERLAVAVPIRPIAWVGRRNRVVGGGLWRIYRQFAVWHAPAAILRRVVRRGVPVRVLAAPDDAKHLTEVFSGALGVAEAEEGVDSLWTGGCTIPC